MTTSDTLPAGTPPIAPARRLPRWSFFGSGIAARELRAAAPLVAIMAVVPLLASYIVKLGQALSGPTAWPSVDYRFHWRWAGAVTAFLLGALCGAEEEENGTLDFALVQPVGPLRVLAAKLAGSALAFAFWGVASVAVRVAYSWVSAQPLRFSGALFPSGAVAAQFAVACLTAFAVALGTGVWVRRVILTVPVAAVLALVVGGAGVAIGESLLGPEGGRSAKLGFAAVLLTGLGLASSVRRYATRGARWGWRGLAAVASIVWKDRRERRLLFWSLAVLVCVGPAIAASGASAEVRAGEATSLLALLFLGPLWCATVMLGGAYYSRVETEPATDFLATLPIAPSRVWFEKSLALLFQWALLVLVAGGATVLAWRASQSAKIISSAWQNGTRPADSTAIVLRISLLLVPILGVLLSLPLLFFSAATRLHIRSRLVHLVLTPLLFSGVVAVSAVACSAALLAGGLGAWLWPVVLAAGLAWWMRYATARTRLRERSPRLRGLLLPLFALIVTVIYAFLALSNWRDLAFLVLGV